MGFQVRSIIKDVNGKPVPQYWNRATQRFEVIESENSELKMILTDEFGNYIYTQSLVDQITDKLDELIEVVDKIGI